MKESKILESDSKNTKISENDGHNDKKHSKSEKGSGHVSTSSDQEGGIPATSKPPSSSIPHSVTINFGGGYSDSSLGKDFSQGNGLSDSLATESPSKPTSDKRRWLFGLILNLPWGRILKWFLGLYILYTVLGPSLCQSWFNIYSEECLISDVIDLLLKVARTWLLSWLSMSGHQSLGHKSTSGFSSNEEAFFIFQRKICIWNEGDPYPFIASRDEIVVVEDIYILGSSTDSPIKLSLSLFSKREIDCTQYVF